MSGIKGKVHARENCVFFFLTWVHGNGYMGSGSIGGKLSVFLGAGELGRAFHKGIPSSSP